MLRLKRELQECVATESFEKAIEIRNQMKMHEKKRENFEMLYETSRFEDDIVMGEPSERFKALDAELEYEENRRN